MLRHAHRPISHLRGARQLTTLSHVTQSTVDHLRRHGYAVQDDVLPKSQVSDLRHEIEELIRVGAATPNKTHVVSSTATRTYQKSSVLQAELHTLSEAHLSAVPNLVDLQNDSSLCALCSVFWPRLTLREQSVKVQRASGGTACFPIHIDSSASRDGRVVTALLYPHEEWGGDGALRVYNTPFSSLDIAPIPGRLVLLSARGMHHRVLPGARERFAITVWLSGEVRRPVLEKPELGSVGGLVAYEMLSGGMRDAAFRVGLEQEWIASLRESHEREEAEELVGEFGRNLEAIRRIVPGVLCQREALDGCNVQEVAGVLENGERLREGFREIEDACGEIPFLW